MKHPLENNPLYQENFGPDWADGVWAIVKIGFFVLVTIALIKYIF